MINEKIFLGTLEIQRFTTLVLSDPCYKPPEHILKEKPKPGNWECYLKNNREGRNAKLILKNKSILDNTKNKYILNYSVDSGQVGIFSELSYQNDKIIKKESATFLPNEPWYSMCCQQTLDTEYGAGFVNHGIVTSTAWGDGEYTATISVNENNEIIKISINLE